LLKRLSRACGFETLDAFPPGHAHARTRWNPAYFDIASDLKPDAIERTLCEAISATPAIFAHIEHPTPRMQQVLLDVIDIRLRRACGLPLDLAAMLVQAYASPHTLEAVPGLRAAIRDTDGLEMPVRARALLAFLNDTPAAYGVIEAPA
jgi:hypothetical protein